MNLNGKWKLYYYPAGEKIINTVDELKEATVDSVAATVPGNVESDLSAAGILPKDLFKGMNILKAEKFETYEWWYEKSFIGHETPDQNQKTMLHFGGVDCYADYFLNGEKIASSANMYVSNDFDVTGKVNYGGENTLHIHIYSAVIKASEYDIEPNLLAFSWHRTAPSFYARKAPHSYGWDIMPRAVSAGIWRDVEIKNVDKYHFKYIYFNLADIEKNETVDGVVDVCFDAVLPQKYTFKNITVKIEGSCGNSRFVWENKAVANAGYIRNKIKDIKLWWPKPYGDPNIYDITVAVYSEAGELILKDQVRRGFRTLELRHSEIVEKNGCFEFVINGKRIMAVGSNWVPLDVYHSRDKGRYQKALEMADDLGCNILRCWGGNVYEDKEFFDFCDRHGIMVWQDFAMACQMYPQNKTFMDILEKEAEWVVAELRDHPSLVLWSGDNEIDSMLAPQGIKPSVNRLTREVLPAVISRLDPHRPYIASSPYISDRAFELGENNQGSKTFPEDHLWGPRDYFKSDFYKNSGAYFVSEAGYHGCPCKKSIEKFIDAEYVWSYTDNEQWNLHSSDQHNSSYRVMLMEKQVRQLFDDVPDNLDDYALASQISQAEAKKFFIEHMRLRMSRNGGIIWWNLIDGWPQMSDAVVDYYYEKKLAYDFIKRSQQPFLVALDEMADWGHPVVCANSTLEPVKGKVTVSDLDSGEIFFEKAFEAGANCNTNLGKLPLMYSAKGMFLISWETEKGQKGFNTYLYGSPKYNLEQYKVWLEKINNIRVK